MNQSTSPPRPYDAIMLSVGDGHWIYVEEFGRRDGIPALFLHGGPGSGAQHSHRLLFNPERFRAILFDQRGSGRSHPYLATDANTTQALIADIEKIREHMNIDRWLVVGGSWGSTLALAYAQAHPERVTGIAMRAVFLGTDEEVTWAFETAPRHVWPELWKAFVEWLPEDERDNAIASYVARLTDPDPARHRPAAQVWSAYERALSELVPPNPELPKSYNPEARLPPTPILTAHYIKNHFFLERGQLLGNAVRLKGIPGVILQGRYDLLCPPATPHALVKRWPECRLRIMDARGHAMTETGVAEELEIEVSKLAR